MDSIIYITKSIKIDGLCSKSEYLKLTVRSRSEIKSTNLLLELFRCIMSILQQQHMYFKCLISVWRETD